MKTFFGALLFCLAICVFLVCAVGIVLHIDSEGLAHPVIIWVLLFASLPLMPYGAAVFDIGEFDIGLRTYWRFAKGWLKGLGFISCIALACLIVFGVFSLM